METSPNFLPSSQPEHPTSLKIALAAISLLLMAAGYYFFYLRPLDHLSSTESEGTESLSPTEDKNPVQDFYKQLSAKDYRIKTKGKILTDTNYTTYYQKGNLIRIDINTPSSSSTVIFKNGKMYNLDHLEKTYMEEDENNPFLSRFVNLYKIISVIEVIIASETPRANSWKQLPSDPAKPNTISYESLNREVNLRSVEGPIYLDMRISVDPATKFITTAVLTAAGAENIEENTVLLEYEEVADIESMKQFSSDYKHKGLFDSLKFVPMEQK